MRPRSAEAAVDGEGVVVFEVFDDHVEGHGGLALGVMG